MPRTAANGLELEYESLGAGEPLLLVMGLGAQLVHWPDELCARLVRAGFRVIRYDNRDVGGSTHLRELRHGKIRMLMARRLLGLPVAAPYTLLDMADDAAALLDALQIDAAHVVGASMGGMIGQTLAIRHPHRVRTLTSIMSTTGARRYMLSRPSAIRALLSPPTRDRAQAVEQGVAAFRHMAGKGMASTETWMRATTALAFDRGHDPRGIGRQLAAILASPDRTGALRFVRAPTTVIHGSDDPLIFPAAGRATARAIPGARFRLVEGMGHDIPDASWDAIVEEVCKLRNLRN